MEFKCDIGDLRRVIAALNYIATKTHNRAPLILIESSVRDQAIKLRSTCGTLSGQAVLKDGVSVDKTGSACILSISANSALHSIKYTDDDKVKVTLDDEGRFNLSSGDIEYKYGSLPEVKFTRFELEKPKNVVTVDSESFSDLLSKTSFAGRQNIPVDFVLSDNLLKLTSIGMIMVSSGAIETDSDVEDRIKVPLLSVQFLHRLINSKSDTKIAWSNNQVMFKCDEFIFSTPISNSVIPDYKTLFDMVEEHPYKFTASKLEVRQKLEAFQALAEQSVPMCMRIKDGKMQLSLDNENAGYVSRIIDCSYSGEEIKIQVNARITFEFCRQFRAGDWEFAIKDKVSPLMIRSVEDGNFKFLQSPMNPGG